MIFLTNIYELPVVWSVGLNWVIFFIPYHISFWFAPPNEQCWFEQVTISSSLLDIILLEYVSLVNDSFVSLFFFKWVLLLLPVHFIDQESLNFHFKKNYSYLLSGFVFGAPFEQSTYSSMATFFSIFFWMCFLILDVFLFSLMNHWREDLIPCKRRYLMSLSTMELIACWPG